MKNKRNQFSGVFKVKVALNAIKGEKILSKLASLHGVHPYQIRCHIPISLSIPTYRKYRTKICCNFSGNYIQYIFTG